MVIKLNWKKCLNLHGHVETQKISNSIWGNGGKKLKVKFVEREVMD
jgi:hypothetical protein